MNKEWMRSMCGVIISSMASSSSSSFLLMRVSQRCQTFEMGPPLWSSVVGRRTMASSPFPARVFLVSKNIINNKFIFLIILFSRVMTELLSAAHAVAIHVLPLHTCRPEGMPSSPASARRPHLTPQLSSTRSWHGLIRRPKWLSLGATPVPWRRRRHVPTQKKLRWGGGVALKTQSKVISDDGSHLSLSLCPSKSGSFWLCPSHLLGSDVAVLGGRRKRIRVGDSMIRTQ